MALTEDQVRLAAFAYGLKAYEAYHELDFEGWSLWHGDECRAIITDEVLAHERDPWLYFLQRCRNAAGEYGALFALSLECERDFDR